MNLKLMKQIVPKYLALYNSIQVILWLLVLLSVGVQKSLNAISTDAYVRIVQSTMILDVFHVALKLTHGGLVTTFLQILSRLVVVWLAVPTARAATSQNIWAQCYFVIMYVSWSLAEIIRYSYYNFKTSPSYWLKWLRYTAFYVLYPAGVFTGELPIIYFAWSASNRLSIIWFVYLLIFAIYIPGFPTLFLHMCKQRKCVLGA